RRRLFRRVSAGRSRRCDRTVCFDADPLAARLHRGRCGHRGGAARFLGLGTSHRSAAQQVPRGGCTASPKFYALPVRYPRTGCGRVLRERRLPISVRRGEDSGGSAMAIDGTPNKAGTPKAAPKVSPNAVTEPPRGGATNGSPAWLIPAYIGGLGL